MCNQKCVSINVVTASTAAVYARDLEQFSVAAAQRRSVEKVGWRCGRNEIMEGLLGFAETLIFFFFFW